MHEKDYLDRLKQMAQNLGNFPLNHIIIYWLIYLGQTKLMACLKTPAGISFDCAH